MDTMSPQDIAIAYSGLAVIYVAMFAGFARELIKGVRRS